MNEKRISPVLRDNAAAIFYVFFLNILLLVPSVLSPVFKKVFTDNILTDGNREWLKTLLALMAGTSLVACAANWLRKSCLLRISERIEVSGAGKYMWLLFNSHMRLFNKKDSYLLLSQSENSKRVSSALTRDVLNQLFNIVSVVFYLVMMFRMDKTMTIIVVLLTVFNFAAVKAGEFIKERLSPEKKPALNPYELVMCDERMSAEAFKNIETLKSTASEAFTAKRLIGGKMAIVNAKRSRDYEEAFRPLDDLPETLFINLLLLVSALRIIDRSLTIGAYLAFQAYAVAVFGPLSEALTVNTVFTGLKRSIKGLYRELELGAEENKCDCRLVTGEDKLPGFIEVKNVTFGYDKNKPVIKDFNLSIKPGQKIAILGRSGAGKTTLLKLLQGIYQPDCGEITIDGIAPACMDKDLYISSIGCANQEAALFQATIRQNITMWDESVTDYDIYNAANDALIHEYITSLNGAYESVLPENGSSLSGGQRQRLEIARALLYWPSIVFIDEALSSVDSKSREAIEDNLARRGCTCVVVTHSLERIQNYDEIIILEDQTAAARGRHEELLQISPLYVSMLEEEGAAVK